MTSVWLAFAVGVLAGFSLLPWAIRFVDWLRAFYAASPGDPWKGD